MAFSVNNLNSNYNKNLEEKTNKIQALQASPIDNSPKSLESFEEQIAAIEEFANKNDEYLNALPPLEFEYRYMPNIVNGNIDKKALFNSAYEEMGGVEELSVKEFEDRYLLSEDFTAEPLDINKDGKIDVSEYSANMLATDMLSKETPDLSKIDGTVNARGMNAILEYTKKSNAAAAAKLYASIYTKANLGSELNKM